MTSWSSGMDAWKQFMNKLERIAVALEKIADKEVDNA